MLLCLGETPFLVRLVCNYQLLGHLLDLGDEVGEELRHVLLLPGVERLLVHRVGFTEWPGVVRFPLALLNGRSVWTNIKNSAFDFNISF